MKSCERNDKDRHRLRVGCVLGSHTNSFSACLENALSVSILQYSTASVVRRARRLLHYASVTHRGVTHTRSHTRSRSSYVQARGQVKKKGVKTPFLLLFLTSLMERPDLLNQAPRGAQFENELLVI